MQKLMIVICLTVLIAAFLLKKSPQSQPVAMRTDERTLPPPTAEVIPLRPVGPVLTSESEPLTTLMPEPVLIVESQKVSVIADEKLRRFVGRNAVFSRDKVLYFEWRGGPNDKMEGITVSDLETKDKRYVISLTQTQGESMLHRQVFIVPKNYTYEVEISQ